MIHYPGVAIRILGRAIWFLALVILCLITIWAAAALYIDLPATNQSLPAAILYLVVVIAVLCFFKFRWISLGICFALFAGVALWWCFIQPSNSRDWQPEVVETSWTQRDGDKITIHNLRNFDYEPGLLAKPRWETKVVDLSRLRGVDLYINFWGSKLICHPIVSFQFGPNDHVAISVETRMAKGQTYSTVRGFFKQFALTYIVADERDVIRVRTNYRHEQLYLYRTSVKPDRARRLFLDYLQSVNVIHVRPQFYNALTAHRSDDGKTRSLGLEDVVERNGRPVGVRKRGFRKPPAIYRAKTDVARRRKSSSCRPRPGLFRSDSCRVARLWPVIGRRTARDLVGGASKF
jgi:Domain of unknown function (DUF4105)